MFVGLTLVAGALFWNLPGALVPDEDTGWIIEQSGDEVCLFSSDYPHVEGGRNPIKRFEASMAGLTEEQRQRFYCDNFVDLMGEGLSRS